MNLMEELQKFLKGKNRKNNPPPQLAPVEEVRTPDSLPLPESPPPSPEKKIRQKTKKNRHGIPLLMDAAETFFSDEKEDFSPLSVQEKSPCPPSLPVQNPAAPKRKKQHSPIAQKIPRLSEKMDLFHEMTAPRAQVQSSRKKLASHTMKKKPALPHQPRPLLKDKNGIPILRDQTDFTRVFHAAENLSASPNQDTGNLKFPVLLGSTLAEKGQDRLLKEKKAGMEASCGISLAERIRRYPEPQKVLDLHGFSGIQARLKTEFFIEKALQDGLFTIRIITGRGLHSEGPAVLPDIVDQKIREMEEMGTVLFWKWENERKEPEGSVRVYLKHFQ